MLTTRGVAGLITTLLFGVWWTLLVDHEPATFVNNLDELSAAWGHQRPLNDGYSSPRRSLRFVVSANRKALTKVDLWLAQSTIDASLSAYPLRDFGPVPALAPDYGPELLDRDLGREPVLTDVLLFLSLYLTQGVPPHAPPRSRSTGGGGGGGGGKKTANTPGRLHVLLLGDDVGKTVFQVLNFHSNAHVVDVSIEDPNPALVRFLVQEREPAPLPDPSSLPFGYASLRGHGERTPFVYKPKENTLLHYAADVQDDSVWAALKGTQFNVILSLVPLDPSFLRYMYSKLTRHNLIHRSEFIFLIDGLTDESLLPIFKDMVKDIGESTPISSCIARMRGGLLGKNAPYHDVGLITTLDLSEFQRRHVVDPIV